MVFLSRHLGGHAVDIDVAVGLGLVARSLNQMLQSLRTRLWSDKEALEVRAKQIL